MIRLAYTTELDPIGYDAICQLAAPLFRVPLAGLHSPTRGTPPIQAARFAVWYVAYCYAAAGYALIGNLAGGRNHTTIMNGVSQADRWQKDRPYYWNLLQDLISQYQAPRPKAEPLTYQQQHSILAAVGAALGNPPGSDPLTYPVQVQALLHRLKVAEYTIEQSQV